MLLTKAVAALKQFTKWRVLTLANVNVNSVKSLDLHKDFFHATKCSERSADCMKYGGSCSYLHKFNSVALINHCWHI